MNKSINSLLYFVLAFFIISGCNSTKVNSNILLIANMNNPNEILISNSDLDLFVNTDLFNENIKFKNLEIISSGEYYYLMAKNQNDKEIYAFMLDRLDQEIYIDRTNIVHSCNLINDQNCDFIKNKNYKIIGCSNCNHSISISE